MVFQIFHSQSLCLRNQSVKNALGTNLYAQKECAGIGVKMKYKSEIFDHVLQLYETTGFNDHQLHCVIRFTNKLEVSTMEAALIQFVKMVPIMSRVYRNNNGNAYWEDTKMDNRSDLFQIVHSEDAFYRFTCSRTVEETGPQIKVCLLSMEKDALSIIINHMVTDGGGLKRCVYLLSDLYSRLLKNPEYVPDKTIDGERSISGVVDGIRYRDRIKILLHNNKDNNQAGACKFPMSTKKAVTPFILTRKLPRDRYVGVLQYGNRHKVTVNDVILTAYFRVLSDMLDKREKLLSFPIMIDMRRYLGDKGENAMTNMSSTVILCVTVNQGEDFNHTLMKVHAQMKAKKENYLGLSTHLKLSAVYKIFGRRLGYILLRKSLKNPVICMTNIGIIDAERLKFEGAPVEDAYACGAIKYRPHFQMAVTSFKDSMTLCVNLYGSRQDQDNCTTFLNHMEEELKSIN
jgi:NRPS condensation-like uncharacterized protein